MTDQVLIETTSAFTVRKASWKSANCWALFNAAGRFRLAMLRSQSAATSYPSIRV